MAWKEVMSSLGSMPRHHSKQKKPLSRFRMSVDVRSQSRWIASSRQCTAVVMAVRARETFRRAPLSLAQRACQMLPMTVMRRRVHRASSLGSSAGLSVVQARRSSARRTAAARGGAALPVSEAQVLQSQSIAGATSGQSRKAWDKVSRWPAAEQSGERHRLEHGTVMAGTRR